MKRWMVCGALLALLLCCGGAAASDPPRANVADYGAVGDAAYHHHLGESRNDWSYWAGHYSHLETGTYHVPCTGERRPASALAVVADGRPLEEGQIHLSDVRSGQTFYKPAVGDTVVAYTAADRRASVPATDDSAAFERAIAEGAGKLYLPPGDYLVSQVTAAKITNLKGPGKIWLKEWVGGTVYYLAAGISEELAYRNYGWVDAEHFWDEAWLDMHWITCLGEVNGWTESRQFSGNVSGRMEFDFHPTRDNLNAWLTVQPAVPEEDFPDSVTICISNLSANYSLEGGRKWRRASGKGIEGAIYNLSWNETSAEVPASAWKDYGDRVEITLKKRDLFRPGSTGKTWKWALHCWTLNNKSLKGQPVKYVCNTARVWIKGEGVEGCLMCDIGGDMRTTWEDRGVPEGYIMEACNSGTQLLTETPRRFYAYTVPDGSYENYQPFPN